MSAIVKIAEEIINKIDEHKATNNVVDPEDLCNDMLEIVRSNIAKTTNNIIEQILACEPTMISGYQLYVWGRYENEQIPIVNLQTLNSLLKLSNEYLIFVIMESDAKIWLDLHRNHLSYDESTVEFERVHRAMTKTKIVKKDTNRGFAPYCGTNLLIISEQRYVDLEILGE